MDRSDWSPAGESPQERADRQRESEGKAEDWGKCCPLGQVDRVKEPLGNAVQRAWHSGEGGEGSS